MSRELGSRYVLEGVLGRGATGEVWHGHHRDGTPLAFKVLHQSLGRDPDVVRRFVQERSVLTGLDHPSLVRMHDLVVEGDTLAIVMDRVAGRDLRAVLAEQGSLAPAEVCRIGADVAAGLAAVHSAGVVHRDIKPENILLDATRTPPLPKLTDFGIAKIAEQSGTGRTTMLAGTPQYIAPELFDGQPPTAAVDLYALGILLYELCCGVTPFVGDSALAVLRRHAEHSPGRPDGIPDPLWELISELLAKNPQARPGSAARVSNTLAALALDLAGAPAASVLSEPPASIPTQPTELVTQPIPPGAIPVPPTPRPTRRRLVIAAAVGTAAAIAIGWGTAAALGLGDQRSGGPTGSPAPVAAGDPTGPAANETASPTSSPSHTPQPLLMPGLVGMPVDQARQLLPEGVAVDIVEEPAPPGIPGGVVLGQEPVEDEPVLDVVVLKVSAVNVTVYLADVDPVVTDGTYSMEVVDISGERYLNSLACGYQYVEKGVWSGGIQYDLGRNYTKLRLTAGLSDRSEHTEADIVLEVVGDSQTLVEEPLVFGEPLVLDIDVTNVLRLSLNWIYLNAPTGILSSESAAIRKAQVVFGTPVLVAAPGYDPSEEAVAG